MAREDCEDLMAADTVIIFTEMPNTILATGGRHLEFGLALAHGKRVIVAGPRENVFHYLLPESQVFATWNQAFPTIRHQRKLCQEPVRRQTKAICANAVMVIIQSVHEASAIVTTFSVGRVGKVFQYRSASSGVTISRW